MTGTRLQRYESSLPEGLASYPQCQHKAAFYRDFMERIPLTGIASRLPGPVRELVENPAPPSTWVPEVHLNALYLATCDLLLDERELIDAMGEVNRRVLSSPLHRIVFMVASPRIAFSSGKGRWRAFHRGSELETTVRGRGGTLELSYPDHLFPELMMSVYERIFQTVFDLISEKAKIRLVSCGPTVARYDLRWG